MRISVGPDIRGILTAALPVLAFLLAAWVLQSRFEARAYERITGVHVSTWDAMFVELRVQEGAK